MASISNGIGNTPLFRLARLGEVSGAEIWVKPEGNNPGGSVKDRAAKSMIEGAEQRGEIRPGDTLIEATSGNTGIALAMIAAIRGYKLKLLMPENMSAERQAAMKAYGAELVLVSRHRAWKGRGTWRSRWQRTGKVMCLISLIIPITRWPITGQQARKSGSRRTGVSRTLSQLWALPAPLPGWRVI